MEKTIMIDERAVRFKSTGALLLRYKSQFGRDFLQDIVKIDRAIDTETNEIKDINYLDMELFYNILWTLAKTADKTIPEPLEWLDGFEVFPLAEILPELKDVIESSLKSTAKSKKK